jgi:hypothetical protein
MIPSGLTEGAYRLQLSNKSRYPYLSQSGTLLSKVDILCGDRMSYKSDIDVALYLNYSSTWLPAVTGVTNRYGSVYIPYSTAPISGIDHCLGIASATVDGNTYISNVIRYNFK